MVKSLDRFHMYYHMRRVLKRLQVPLPYKSGFNAADNPFSSEWFFKICDDYEIPHDPMKHSDGKFYWTYQQGVSWPSNYIGLGSMTFGSSKNLRVLLMWGCLEFLGVMAYVYLVLSSQASARSRIVGNMASALTAQKAF